MGAVKRRIKLAYPTETKRAWGVRSFGSIAVETWKIWPKSVASLVVAKASAKLQNNFAVTVNAISAKKTASPVLQIVLASKVKSASLVYARKRANAETALVTRMSKTARLVLKIASAPQDKPVRQVNV